MKPSISIKESEEPATKVVVLADSDQEGQDVDFEPPASTIKSSTEALRLVDDLKAMKGILFYNVARWNPRIKI